MLATVLKDGPEWWWAPTDTRCRSFGEVSGPFATEREAAAAAREDGFLVLPHPRRGAAPPHASGSAQDAARGP